MRINSPKLLFIVLFTIPAILSADYLGGEYRTIDNFLYGRFEVVFKPAQGDGLVSSFFTYNDQYPNTPWCEIDLEVLGRYEDVCQFNAITNGQLNHLRHQFLNFNPHLDFHTYAFEWTPDYVAWFVDGTEYYRQEGGHVELLTEPQKIMMNIWNPVFDNWVGDWNEEILPRFAYYDQASYSAYTPGEGDSGSSNNFSLMWVDHFDDWDETRWEKATHGFPGNQCTFTPENVVFQDGCMILCLTDDIYTGYVDNYQPRVLWARASESTITIRFSEELDPVTANSTSAYMIAGLTIDQAVLDENARTVNLSVSGMNLSQTYSLIILGIDDLSGNSLLGQVISINMPEPLDVDDQNIKINIGGAEWQEYLPDQEWGPAVEYGFLDGSVSQEYNSPEILNTDSDELFWLQRFGLVQYNVRVPDGVYQVFLNFSENNWTDSGNRQFDVFIESEPRVQNFDIYDQAGSFSALSHPIYNCQVDDGVISLVFCAESDAATLAAIEISSAIAGCTDPDALNFNPDAEYDDGSCSYCSPGDVNSDGFFDILDIVVTVDLILNTEPSPCQLLSADLNSDGSIDVADIVLMVELILNWN